MSKFFKNRKGTLKKAFRNAQIALGKGSAMAGLAAGVVTGDIIGGLAARQAGKNYATLAQARKDLEQPKGPKS